RLDAHRVATRAAIHGHAGGFALQHGLVVLRALEREGVARRAVGLGARTEALRRLLARVLDVALLLVAARAALGLRRAHRAFGGRLVTLGALDLFLDDVNAMSRDVARNAPRLV